MPDVVAFANDAGHPDSERARSVVRALNPRAAVIDLSREELPDDFLSATRSFDIAAGESGGAEHQPDSGSNGAASGQGGFSRITFDARRPFHPQRFAEVLKSSLAGVFRAKGFFWLATQMEHAGGLSFAGAEKRAAPLGEWWASFAAREPGEHTKPERIASEWREPFGDRRQALTFFGFHVDESALRTRLHDCLLTDAEMAAGERAWASMPDPFAAWRQSSPAADAHPEHACCDHGPAGHHEHHHHHGDDHECGHHCCHH
jgi:G3E family GTPase